MRLHAYNEALPSSASGRHGTAIDSRKQSTIDSVVADSFPSSPQKSEPLSTAKRTFLSPSRNDEKIYLNSAVIPYECHELDTTHVRSIDSPVDDDEGIWVGIGCGEAFTLNTSACSESPLESYLGKHSIRNHNHVPKAIDFQKFASDNLTRVDEDKTSNINSDILQKKPFIERIGTESVAELSTDLSVMESSIASVMTKEGCIDLAKRFEKMEHILMQRAGEKSKSDALRALAKATHKQSKRAELLQEMVNKQEKKNSVLNHRCQQLIHDMTENKRALSDMKTQIDELNCKNAGQRSELHRYKSQNKDLKSNLKEMSDKVQKLEEENNNKSRLLLHSYSEKNASAQLLKEIDELRLDSSRRANADKATIEKLQMEISQLRKMNAAKEKRSVQKIQILMEIKSALEEQICLLEERTSSDN